MTTPEDLRLAKQKWKDHKCTKMKEINKNNFYGEKYKKSHSRHRMESILAHANKKKLI